MIEECGLWNPYGQDWEMWSKLNIYIKYLHNYPHIAGSHTQRMLIHHMYERRFYMYSIACYIVISLTKSYSSFY